MILIFITIHMIFNKNSQVFKITVNSQKKWIWNSYVICIFGEGNFLEKVLKTLTLAKIKIKTSCVFFINIIKILLKKWLEGEAMIYYFLLFSGQNRSIWKYITISWKWIVFCPVPAKCKHHRYSKIFPKSLNFVTFEREGSTSNSMSCSSSVSYISSGSWSG